ncbi:Crp/Fnr family transcriptional regulator [Brevundimonas sp. R86498]|uniref:Crp/Fnr family transcriptional regulator n=1 Tax=Brevundimonas sp. R86498 TaxID=3093845 RepID=UPI0037CA5717
MSESFENRFISALDPEDLDALRPMLRRVSVTADQIVVDQDAPVELVHFPIDSQFANLIRFPDGTAIETAVIGNEGLTGLAPVMADLRCGWDIGCRTSGEAYVVAAQALRALAADRSRVMARLMALTDLYQSQAAHSAACNATHTVHERVARWFLTTDDLSPRNTMIFRQEEMARLIGARRSTVSEAASELKRRKLIAYNRGVIRILDRPGLEAAACDCYRMLKPRLDGLYS